MCGFAAHIPPCAAKASLTLAKRVLLLSTVPVILPSEALQDLFLLPILTATEL